MTTHNMASTEIATIDTNALITAMRKRGHEHLIHYAGAAHRDRVAYAMCLAYLEDPQASEAVLKSRALKAVYGT
jgi:hypothetical protein